MVNTALVHSSTLSQNPAGTPEVSAASQGRVIREHRFSTYLSRQWRAASQTQDSAFVYLPGAFYGRLIQSRGSSKTSQYLDKFDVLNQHSVQRVRLFSEQATNFHFSFPSHLYAKANMSEPIVTARFMGETCLEQ